MHLDADAAYAVLRARDARFDGRVFVGVTSTGVYCRPVCRVRTPRRENCRFFASRALAEAAGFRPCLKCRPEIAPGLSAMDSPGALADAAARWIAQAVHAGEPVSMRALAARLGVTDRHLRRVFALAHGVSPQAWRDTQRLLLAKQLLTDTALPVAQVALASGFASLRRFNAAFAERYRMPPGRLRRAAGAGAAGGDADDDRAAREAAPADRAGPVVGRPAWGRDRAERVLRLAWRPPYDIEGVLGHHARRTVAGVEQVQGLALRRTLALPGPGGPHAGAFEARFVPERHEVHLFVDDGLAAVQGALLQRVRRALDLDADAQAIDAMLAALPLPPRPGARLTGAFCGFEAAVRVILGQQVTVKAARTLVQRLVARFGRPVVTRWPGLDRLFPDAATLAAADPADIGTLGIVRQRVGALRALAAEVSAGRLLLHPAAPLEPTLAALRALPGVGEWTAQLVALRALGWPDAWPAADVGLMLALGTRDARAVQARAEAWRPWRGYALMRLWHAVETGEIAPPPPAGPADARAAARAAAEPSSRRSTAPTARSPAMPSADASAPSPAPSLTPSLALSPAIDTP